MLLRNASVIGIDERIRKKNVIYRDKTFPSTRFVNNNTKTFVRSGEETIVAECMNGIEVINFY